MNPSTPPNALTGRLRLVPLWSGAISIAIGLTIVVGWRAHWMLLAHLFPGALPMKYNAGLSAILCGMALVMLTLRRVKLMALLAFAVTTFMGMTQIENVTGTDFKIDGVFFNSYDHVTLFPNRVSPITAACFFLLGSALLLTGVRAFSKLRLTVVGMISCCSAITAFVAMFGCTFGIETASGWGLYTRMSPYTACSIIVLNAGLLVWAWRRAQAEGEGINFLRWLPVSASLTLMAMIALISAASFFQLKKSSDWRRHTYVVLGSAQALLGDIFDSQRGARAFVLTGQLKALAPYNAGSSKAPRDLAELLSLTQDNARQQANLKVLSAHYDELIDYTRGLIKTRERSFQDSIRLESGGTGFDKLNATLAGLRTVTDEEHRLLTIRSAAADADFNNTSRLLILGSILAAALLALANIMASSEVQLRRRAEETLQKTNRQLEAARDAAEKANLAKSDFLSNMSHELRTPLSAILGFAQLMQSSEPPPTAAAAKSINQILQSGWHLLKLINEVLDLASIESGKLLLSKESISLAEVFLSCQSMVELQAEEHDIELRFPILKEDVYVRADRTRLEQIMINLLSNAIKYNREHGKVTVECAARAPDRVRISVTDCGAGLPPEKLEQLFTPFNRLGQENGDISGTGVGLVVCKRLAESMDGVLGVESTVGEGTTFWCELFEADAPPAREWPDREEAMITEAIADGGPQRTLVYVEDNPANLELVEELVTRFSDMKLVTAVDASVGIELIRSLQPQVILMDINLPGISGSAALKILLADKSTSHIPVVALTANAMASDVKSGLKEGFYRYLTKPVQIGEFVSTLRDAVKRSEQNPAPIEHEGMLS